MGVILYQVILGKCLLVTLGRDLSERALTSFKKNLDVVVNGIEAKTEKTGLEMAKLINGGISVLFTLKDTAMLYVFINCLCL